VSQPDQHLTTEQLSASLDQQLAPQEQDQLDAHLKTCEECQVKLAELRQTVALLHALPQPKLPRSFALPVETVAVPVVTPRERATEAVAVVTPGEQKRRSETPRSSRPDRPRLTYIRTTIRVMSTLAAMVGVIFLLSGLLGGLHTGGGATTSASAGIAPSTAQNASKPEATPAANVPKPTRTVASAVGELSPIASTSAAVATPEPSPTTFAANNNGGGTSTQSQRLSEPPPAPPLIDLSTAGGRALLGIILLVLSLCGLIFLRMRPQRTEVK